MKMDMLGSIGKQAGESVGSVPKKKKGFGGEGFVEKEGFKSGMKERGSD